jgi:hypothetical protein
MANLDFLLQKSKYSLISKLTLLAVAVVVTAGTLTNSAGATHSWGSYHWARQTNPFTLRLSSNLTSDWQSYLATASSDWSASSVLDTSVVTGAKNPKTCKPTQGQVEVCNAKYGNNGWLGLAQIWISGGSHITQGAVKMNDTYMTRAPYNTPAEKNHVMCQEVGHTFGLGHQDETGAALGTCMDYSTDAGSQHPNSHDYAQLVDIYSHLDTTTTVGTSTTSSASSDASDLNSSQNWGRRVFRSQNGFVEVYERTFQDGSKLISAVYLAH